MLYRIAGVVTLGLAASGAGAAEGLQTLDERISYVAGFQIGQQLKREGVPVDKKSLFAAIEDVLTGKEPRLTLPEMQAAMKDFQQRQQAEMAQRGEVNRQKGQAFLAENRTKAGVQTAASGLQYKVVKSGTGPKPLATDTVTVHYRGTLIDGNEFDSSYKRNEPASFQVGGVIKGWQEALQMMPVGSKWQVVLPSELAYGERGAGADIGPNAVLIFDVELLAITR